MNIQKIYILFSLLIVCLLVPVKSFAILNVVTTISDYADFTSRIGGDLVQVQALVAGTQDAHFIRPRPSFVEALRKADMLVATGLDLEMWLPSAVDKSGNRKIRSGEKGYVSVASGMLLKDKPVSLSKIDGGLHLYGNPHITVSPLNIFTIIENIKIGLCKNAPESRDVFEKNAEKIKNEISTKLYGEPLNRVLGRDALISLHRSGKLFDFLQKRSFKDKPLIKIAGGWYEKMIPLRGAKVVTYHKNWRYLIDDFGMIEGGFIEPKPGIPPSPRHIRDLQEKMKKENIKLIIAANYFDKKTVDRISESTGARNVMLPYYVGGKKDLQTWEELFDFWVQSITRAYNGGEDEIPN